MEKIFVWVWWGLCTTAGAVGTLGALWADPSFVVWAKIAGTGGILLVWGFLTILLWIKEKLS